MDDVDAMYRAGRARQGGMPCPKGGGLANGGRVAKAGYARGGMVDGAPSGGKGGGGMEHSRQRSQAAGMPALAKGGRVKGKGC